MSKRQDHRSKNDSPSSARPSALPPAHRSADQTGWSPLFRALRREFRDNLARVAAGNDPLTRLLGYRTLLMSRYGADLPAADDGAERGAEKPGGEDPGNGR